MHPVSGRPKNSEALRDSSGCLVSHRGALISVRPNDSSPAAPRDPAFLGADFTHRRVLPARPPLQRTTFSRRHVKDDLNPHVGHPRRHEEYLQGRPSWLLVPTPNCFTDFPIEPRSSSVVRPPPYILADRTFRGLWPEAVTQKGQVGPETHGRKSGPKICGSTLLHFSSQGIPRLSRRRDTSTCSVTTCPTRCNQYIVT